jgi:NAD(P) transhydrogenase subunit beta
VGLAYLIAGVLFIMALRGLSSPGTSRAGNRYGMIGMTIAVATTLVTHSIASLPEIAVAIAIGGGIGFVIARRIQMTAMPQLVAAFHSLVGLAAVLVGLAAYANPGAFGILDAQGLIEPQSRIEMGLGIAIGAITFSGSIIAQARRQDERRGDPAARAPCAQPGHAGGHPRAGGLVHAGRKRLGDRHDHRAVVCHRLPADHPHRGADMPVVVSMLNSYSGWAAAAMGFTLHNTAMIITGALVGSSGAILSYIMCKAMNRSFLSVIAGGFGAEAAAAAAAKERPRKRGSAEDAAFLMKEAENVIIIPGYGMAVSQAQHALREMADVLKANGVNVKYAIHPVAGRMPGHMNVLLAEANVPYDEVFELEDIQGDFAQATWLHHRRQRRGQPGGQDRQVQPDLWHAGVRRGQGQDDLLRQALDGRGRLFRRRQRRVLHGPDDDAAGRRQEDGRGDRQGVAALTLIDRVRRARRRA